MALGIGGRIALHWEIYHEMISTASFGLPLLVKALDDGYMACINGGISKVGS
jgi:hypothetical protein